MNKNAHSADVRRLIEATPEGEAQKSLLFLYGELVYSYLSYSLKFKS